MYLVKAKAVVSKLRRQVKQFENRAVGRSEHLGVGGGLQVVHSQGLLKVKAFTLKFLMSESKKQRQITVVYHY